MAGALGFLLAGSSPAASLIWTNGSGAFSSGVNWNNSGNPPANGDRTVFTNDTSYTVTFAPTPVIINSNLFNGHAGAVTLDISGTTWTVTNLFSVGQTGSATATVYLAGGTLAVTNNVGNTTNG